MRAPRPDRWLRLAVLVLFGSGLASLASGAFGPRYGGRAALGVLGMLPGVGPSVPSTTPERLVQGLVHETLVRAHPLGVPSRALAQRISPDPTGRSVLLTLPDDARFHDGSPLGADDVVRSLRRFLRTRESHAAQVLADGLVGARAFRDERSTDLPGVEAAGAQGVLLRFDQARAQALLALASPAAAITGANGQGCGPFMPAGTSAGQMTFKAFVAHGQGRPYLDEVALESYPTRAALNGALARGRIDAALGLAPEGSAFERSAALLLLVLDSRRAPFDRPSARAALAARFAAHVAGLARLVRGQRARGLLSPALAWPAFESDATGAQGLPLSGHVCLAVARDVPPLASQHVAALLADAGLQVDVQPGEARAAAAEARLLLFVPEVAEVGLVLEELAALGTPIPALEAWLAQARREANADARRALLLKAESALRAERVLLPLLDLPTDFVASADLLDAQVDAAGYVRLADAWRRP